MRYDAGPDRIPASLMLALFNRFLDLALMRCPPQDFPPSRFLLGLVVVAYAVLAFGTSLLVSENAGYSALGTLLAVADIGVGLALVLRVARRPERWLQTSIAIYGGKVVLIVFTLPVMLAFALGISNFFVGVSQLLLVIWQVVFIGFVMRNALDTGMGAGVAVALIFVIGTEVFEQWLLPFPGT